MIDKLGSLPAGVSQCMRQIGPNTHSARQNVMARLKGFYVEIKPQWYMDILDSDYLQIFQCFRNMLWKYGVFSWKLISEHFDVFFDVSLNKFFSKQ